MKKTIIKKVLILSLFLTITSCSINQKSNFKYDYLIDKPSFDSKEEVKEDEFNKTYQEFKYNFDNIYLINFIQNETSDDLSSKTSLILGVKILKITILIIVKKIMMDLIIRFFIILHPLPLLKMIMVKRII